MAAWLYLAGVFWLDRLMMPARFWANELHGEDRRRWLPRRPPSPDVRIVYANMTRIWDWYVLTATVLLGLGLILLTPALVKARGGVGYWWFAVPVVLAVMLGLFTKRKRPVLGVTD